jgi:TonB-dependent starch-binding outer membrane protein SusC
MNLIVHGKAVPRPLPTKLLMIKSLFGGFNPALKRQIVMQIKLTAIFIFVLSLHISAKSFSQKVTISGKALTLDRVFDEIENQTGYQFIYDKAILKKVKPVALHIKEASIEDALSQCLKGQPFTYQIEDKIITISSGRPTNQPAAVLPRPVPAALPEPPPPPGIHGTVVNDANSPLEGASIMVKGTHKGTQTDAKGTFQLDGVATNATLIISYSGFETQQIKINAKTEFVVRLKPSNNPLDETQVIAYGTNTRRMSVSSVSTVTSADIAQEPVSNVMEVLEGRIPGLDISQTNGLPGTSQAISIRGLNSLNNTANNPLFLVDGVPFLSTSLGMTGSLPGTFNQATPDLSMNSGLSPFNLLNPGDIESITVLKDADATSIYGSRGSNGVILITTKKGKAGNQTQVDVNISSGFGKVGHFIDLLNTPQYLEMRHEAFNNDGETPNAGNAPDLLVWDTTRYTNWQKVLLGGSANYNNDQVSLSGGSENTSFLVNASHQEQGSVLPGGFGDNKDAGHFSLDHSSANKKFKTTLSVGYLVDNNTFSDSYFVSDALTLAPDAPPIYTIPGQLNWANSTWTNPFAALSEKFHAKSNNLTANGLISYDIIKGLQVRTTLGYNNVQFNSTDPIPEAAIDPALYQDGQSSNTFTSSNTETWNIEPQAEYRRVLGPGRLDVLTGGTFEQMVAQQQSIAAYGYLTDALLNDLASASTWQPTTSYIKYNYDAAFARINYIVSSKYIFDFTGRRDGSSRFGPGKQFGNFGSAGAGWLFGDEGLIKNSLPFLSYGKLRGSYGTTGSDNIGDYGFISTYSATYNPYGGSTGLVPNNLANPYYSWESNKKLDIGLELGFLKDRILFSTDYFLNRSSNQLVGYTLPSTTGFTTINYNLPATVQNNGLEFQINTVNIRTKQFTWQTSLNFTVPRNKLVSYPGLANSTNSYLYMIGEPLDIKKVLPFAGIDPATGVATYYNAQGKLVNSLRDLSLPQDFSAPVNLDKKYFGGMQNSFQYKSWQLTFLVQIAKQLGNKNMPNVAGSMNNQPVQVEGRWQKPGDITDIPKFTQDPSLVSYQNWAYTNTTNGYTDASFVRLKNLSLSYTMPSDLMRQLHLRTARLYLQAQNLFVITPYKYGLDPETQGYLLPPLRQFVFGIQVTL